MEPIGSHYAVLLHDRQLRSTLVTTRESRPWRPSLTLTRIASRARALAGMVRIELGEFRQAILVRGAEH
jgi:hypothetical protein